MADLLTHALIGYTMGMLLSWRYKWVKPSYITMIMVGAVLPDVVRIRLLLDPILIETYLGIPFSWAPLHTLGGVLVSGLIITSLFESKMNKRIFLVVMIGALSHLVLDALLITASGHSYAVLWPFTYHRPIIPGLYLSSNVLPAVISSITAAIVWRIDSYISPSQIDD
ncbi:MAG: metal-dependent hydrolase [Candidatus Natronoplasma sp.]